MSFLILEILILIILVITQSIFGVGILLFGTPSFLLLGYDFPNTINILLPISICISLLQFSRSKKIDKKFIINYNLYCLPPLIFFLILALNFSSDIDFKFFVSLVLIISSFLILNKDRIIKFKYYFSSFKKINLIIIGCVHGFTSMGGSFLSIYSTLISKNDKELSRYFISYGYLVMGIIQYFVVLLFAYKILDFSKLFYVLIAGAIYLPAQKIFNNIKNNDFSKTVNLIAFVYGLIIFVSYLN